MAREALFVRHEPVIRTPQAWLAEHGGDLAIVRCTGQDAADDTDALHWSRILPCLKRYVVARVQHGDDG
ncbi:hypothetical protein AURDEDRAFT_136133 [Auricularia subglabra TFB-10046 SS5]|nr:hypothetical protein AURDEDRAFT_136133 [Auricularia subglabra TFB-10046 SS5]